MFYNTRYMRVSKETLILTNTHGMAMALGRAFGLGRVSRDEILTRKGTRILWVSGPVFRHYTPGEYRPRWKTYRLSDLPIIADPRFKPIAGSRNTIDAIKTALQSAGRVIHAGTPDHHGQYLVDYLLTECGWQGTTERLWPLSLHPEDLKNPILMPNTPQQSITDAEICRIHADWLIGINLSRALTLKTNQSKPMPAGRVMTTLMEMLRILSQHPEKSGCSCTIHKPFDTGHLQAACLQEAGILPEKAAIAAQKLYESGHISYPFTQSRSINRDLWMKHHQQPVPDELEVSGSPLHSGILLLQTQIRKRLHPDEDAVIRCVASQESRLFHRGRSYRPTRNLPPLANLFLALSDAGAWAKSPDLQNSGVQIGTPRSRHTVLTRIFDAGYADRVSLALTAQGQQALSLIPESVKDPGAFVLWESALDSVAEGVLSNQQFMQRIHSYVHQITCWKPLS